MVFLSVIWLPQAPTLDHSQGGNCTQPILITMLYQVWLKGPWEPCGKAGPKSPVKSVYGINWKPSNSEFHALSHCAPLRPWSISNWKIIVALTSRITNTSKMVLLLKVFGVPYQWKHFYTSLSWFEYNHFCHLYVPRTS